MYICICIYMYVRVLTLTLYMYVHAHTHITAAYVGNDARFEREVPGTRKKLTQRPLRAQARRLRTGSRMACRSWIFIVRSALTIRSAELSWLFCSMCRILGWQALFLAIMASALICAVTTWRCGWPAPKQPACSNNAAAPRLLCRVASSKAVPPNRSSAFKTTC